MNDFRDDDKLYRRIVPTHWHKKKDRPSSAAFKDKELSVDWSRYCTPLETKSRELQTGSGVVSITIRFVRGLEIRQEIVWCPLVDNKAHTLIVGNKPRNAIARQFAVASIKEISCVDP